VVTVSAPLPIEFLCVLSRALADGTLHGHLLGNKVWSNLLRCGVCLLRCHRKQRPNEHNDIEDGGVHICLPRSGPEVGMKAATENQRRTLGDGFLLSLSKWCPVALYFAGARVLLSHSQTEECVLLCFLRGVLTSRSHG